MEKEKDFKNKIPGRPKQAVRKETINRFRSTRMERKVIELNAKNVGLSFSEYVRKQALKLEMKERFSPEEVEAFKLLAQYSNNFKNISNYIKNVQGVSPQMLADIEQLRKDIQTVIQKFK